MSRRFELLDCISDLDSGWARQIFASMDGRTAAGDSRAPSQTFGVSYGSDGLALSVVHSLVIEHGGHLSAQRTAEGRCRLEMLLPHWSAKPILVRPETGGAPAILLVDDRDQIRLQLHNFFEANGYNLLEAADSTEALAIGEVHEGALNLLIAEATQADSIGAGIRRAHPHVEVLKIVDEVEAGVHEIRRPFTQQALLERVRSLIEAQLNKNPRPR